MYGFEDNKISGHGTSEYLIVPADLDADVTIYLCGDNSLKEVLYRSDKGDPVIVSADSSQSHRYIEHWNSV